VRKLKDANLRLRKGFERKVATLTPSTLSFRLDTEPFAGAALDQPRELPFATCKALSDVTLMALTPQTMALNLPSKAL
jgi:hypothetical protein